MGDLHRLGPAGEAHAARLLETRGHRIIERNFRCPQGELDLVTWHCDTLVFVEVRARQENADVHPLASVQPTKQHRVIKAAHWFLARKWRKAPPPCRFDVVWLSANQNKIVDGGIVEGAFSA